MLLLATLLGRVKFLQKKGAKEERDLNQRCIGKTSSWTKRGEVT